jgi:hypothetical protein
MARQTARHESRRLKSLGGAHRHSLSAIFGARTQKSPLAREGNTVARAGHRTAALRSLSCVSLPVKTGKVRGVPIHPHLIEVGLMDYVEAVKARLGPKGPLSYRPQTNLRASIPLSGVSGWPNGCGCGPSRGLRRGYATKSADTAPEMWPISMSTSRSKTWPRSSSSLRTTVATPPHDVKR